MNYNIEKNLTTASKSKKSKKQLGTVAKNFVGKKKFRNENCIM